MILSTGRKSATYTFVIYTSVDRLSRGWQIFEQLILISLRLEKMTRSETERLQIRTVYNSISTLLTKSKNLTVYHFFEKKKEFPDELSVMLS